MSSIVIKPVALAELPSSAPLHCIFKVMKLALALTLKNKPIKATRRYLGKCILILNYVFSSALAISKPHNQLIVLYAFLYISNM
jgi:hypothetical protein